MGGIGGGIVTVLAAPGAGNDPATAWAAMVALVAAIAAALGLIGYLLVDRRRSR